LRSRETCFSAASQSRACPERSRRVPRLRSAIRRADGGTPLDCITTLAGSRRDTLVAANTTKAHREGANVMLIIGCDFYPGFQQVAIFDNQTGEYQEKR